MSNLIQRSEVYSSEEIKKIWQIARDVEHLAHTLMGPFVRSRPAPRSYVGYRCAVYNSGSKELSRYSSAERHERHKRS